MKLICVSSDLSDIRKARDFAKKNKCQLELYSVDSWNRQQEQAYMYEKSSVLHSGSSTFKQDVFRSMDEIKIRAIKNALLLYRGNASKAAKMLKIGRATLYRISKQFGVETGSIHYDESSATEEKAMKKSA